MNKIHRLKIIVFGDIFLDEYIDGYCNRLSPESPIPILNYIKKKYNLGGAANVASNLKNLEVKVSICSQIGIDKDAETIKSLLKEQKFSSVHLFKNKNIETIIKTRITSKNHQFIRIDKEPLDIERYYFVPNKNNYKIIEDLIKKNEIIVLSDYGKGFFTKNLIKKIISISKKFKRKTIIDPKKNNSDISIYKNADFFKPNLFELKTLFSEFKNDDLSIASYAKILIKKYNFKALIITRSEDGITLVTKDKVIHDKIDVKSVYDVSGAGDTVLSVVSSLLNSNLTYKQIIEIANKSALRVILSKGTVPINKNDFKKIIEPYINLI